MATNKKKIVIAPAGTRIIAFLFDALLNLAVALILLLPSIIALINVFVNEAVTANVIALYVATLISGALVICFVIFYFVALPVFWNGQTFGKRFFGIKIIDTHTNEGPNAKVMFIRESIRIIIAMLTFGFSELISLLVLCISKKHLAFHEVISSTRVVMADTSEKVKELEQ